MTDPRELVSAKVQTELLDTKGKRQNVVESLQILQTMPGWIFLEKLLKYHIEAIEQTILNEEELSQEAAKEMKHDRTMFLLFKNMPMDIAKGLMREDIQEKDQEEDPYE